MRDSRAYVRIQRGWIESTKAGNRAPQVDTSAPGNPGICAQPGRKGKRVPGVRYRPQYFCRRSPGCRAPLFAALGAGFPRNPQRTLSHRRRSSQSFPHGARSIGPDHPRRGLPPDWIEVLPSSTQSHFSTSTRRPKESCFFGVKIFSLVQSAV